MQAGVVSARVAGSSLYTTTVKVQALSAAQWDALVARHASGIASVVSLLEGTLPQSLLEALANPAAGLFPKPAELEFSCSCPDWATMCKHVAAVLYGVGARLDSQPELFFVLRGVEVSDLAARGGAVTFDAPGEDALAGADLSALFGIALDDAPAERAPTSTPMVPTKAAKPPATKKPTAPTKAAKPPATKKPTKAAKPPAPKKPSKPPSAVAVTPDLPAKRRRRPAREVALAAMIEEACVDAHDEYEQATGFHAMLENHLALPFDIEALGGPATVIALEITDGATLVAVCKRGRRRHHRVALESLVVPEPAPAGADWIAAYRQWLNGR